MRRSLILFFILLLAKDISGNNINNKVDLVIFSYDRPLQLYALLESIERFVVGLDRIHVIYRISAPEYEVAYDQVHKKFPTVIMTMQGKSPHDDFKLLTFGAVFSSPNKYIVFAVDDNVVTNSIDLTRAVAMLEKCNAYGFYFRLGKNTIWSYFLNCLQGLPKFRMVASRVLMWQFYGGRGDWAYPNALDFVLYRKSDIENDLKIITYVSPNTLEGAWHSRSGFVLKRNGLCYMHSKMVNVPLNRVGEFDNKHMSFLSAAKLLEVFNNGLKIDLNPLVGINNKSPHMEYCPVFIQR